jgi:hypothetical protein
MLTNGLTFLGRLAARHRPRWPALIRSSDLAGVLLLRSTGSRWTLVDEWTLVDLFSENFSTRGTSDKSCWI